MHAHKRTTLELFERFSRSDWDMIAEGDRVAAEVESHGDLKNGRRYRQRYQFAIVFRAGQICTVHEYLDTQHAFDIWFRE